MKRGPLISVGPGRSLPLGQTCQWFECQPGYVSQFLNMVARAFVSF